MKKKINEKKKLLDHLYYDVGHQQYDFWLNGTYKVKDEIKFTKWKKYSECIFPIDFDGTSEDKKAQKFFEQINQRQILPIEIVLDIEKKEDLDEIKKKLQELALGNYSIYDTGSRGYHIHIYSLFPVWKPVKEFFIKIFRADIVKTGEKTMIALENTPHWKTGKTKRLLEKYEKRFE